MIIRWRMRSTCLFSLSPDVHSASISCNYIHARSQHGGPSRTNRVRAVLRQFINYPDIPLVSQTVVGSNYHAFAEAPPALDEPAEHVQSIAPRPGRPRLRALLCAWLLTSPEKACPFRIFCPRLCPVWILPRADIGCSCLPSAVQLSGKSRRCNTQGRREEKQVSEYC